MPSCVLWIMLRSWTSSCTGGFVLFCFATNTSYNIYIYNTTNHIMHARHLSILVIGNSAKCWVILDGTYANLHLLIVCPSPVYLHIRMSSGVFLFTDDNVLHLKYEATLCLPVVEQCMNKPGGLCREASVIPCLAEINGESNIYPIFHSDASRIICQSEWTFYTLEKGLSC